MNEKFLIGWGEEDITPENANVELAGQYYPRVATGIHSRIKCVALALEKGDSRAVEVCLDVVGISDELQSSVAAAIAEAIPELKADEIFLNAIHTHSAPYTRSAGLFRDWLKLDPNMLPPAEYVQFLTGKIVKAVSEAWRTRAPGGIATGFGFARIGHCRRPVFADGVAQMYGDPTRQDFIGLEAGEDSGVELLFTFDANDRPTGAVVNIPCPSQAMEATYKISSDYMGASRELLKKEFGPGFHTLCQVSAAGCQSPRDLVRHCTTEPDFWHEDGVPVLAGRVFDAVMRGYKARGAIDRNPVFEHRVQVVTLPVRRASFSEYKKAKEELAGLLAIMPEKEAFDEFCATTHANEAIPGRPGPYDDKEQHFVQIQNRKAVIARYESQDETPNYRFPMHTMRLGDAAVTTNPFELYLHFGQIIKARSRARQTFIVQLCTSTCGYLPSPDAERFGGYGGMIINGQVGSDGGCKLVEESVGAINKLFGAK